MSNTELVHPTYLNEIFKEWFIFFAFKRNARKPEEKDLNEHRFNNLKITQLAPVLFFLSPFLPIPIRFQHHKVRKVSSK